MNSPFSPGVLRLTRMESRTTHPHQGKVCRLDKWEHLQSSSAVVFFITEMTPPLKSLAQASCFLPTIPFPFRHWFKSYFPISLTTTPTFLILHIQLRDSQTIIFYNISTNNLKFLALCLFIIHLATNPAFVLSMTWNNRLVPNRKRSMSRLYIVTLLI